MIIMELILNKEEFILWKKENISPDDIAEEPKEFPCYAMTAVVSWPDEEKEAVYFYKADLKEMISRMDAIQGVRGS